VKQKLGLKFSEKSFTSPQSFIETSSKIVWTEMIEESLTMENVSEVSDEEDLAAKLQKARKRQEAYLRQIHQAESSSKELTCVTETNADFFHQP